MGYIVNFNHLKLRANLNCWNINTLCCLRNPAIFWLSFSCLPGRAGNIYIYYMYIYNILQCDECFFFSSPLPFILYVYVAVLTSGSVPLVVLYLFIISNLAFESSVYVGTFNFPEETIQENFIMWYHWTMWFAIFGWDFSKYSLLPHQPCAWLGHVSTSSVLVLTKKNNRYLNIGNITWL